MGRDGSQRQRTASCTVLDPRLAAAHFPSQSQLTTASPTAPPAGGGSVLDRVLNGLLCQVQRNIHCGASSPPAGPSASPPVLANFNCQSAMSRIPVATPGPGALVPPSSVATKYRRHATVTDELLDPELVQAQTFKKARPEAGWLSVMLQAGFRATFLPFCFSWWKKEVMLAQFLLLLLSWTLSLANLVTLYHNPSANQSSANSTAAAATPDKTAAATGSQPINVYALELTLPSIYLFVLTFLYSHISNARKSQKAPPSSPAPGGVLSSSSHTQSATTVNANQPAAGGFGRARPTRAPQPPVAEEDISEGLTSQEEHTGGSSGHRGGGNGGREDAERLADDVPTRTEENVLRDDLMNLGEERSRQQESVGAYDTIASVDGIRVPATGSVSDSSDLDIRLMGSREDAAAATDANDSFQVVRHRRHAASSSQNSNHLSTTVENTVTSGAPATESSWTVPQPTPDDFSTPFDSLAPPINSSSRTNLLASPAQTTARQKKRKNKRKAAGNPRKRPAPANVGYISDYEDYHELNNGSSKMSSVAEWLRTWFPAWNKSAEGTSGPSPSFAGAAFANNGDGGSYTVNAASAPGPAVVWENTDDEDENMSSECETAGSSLEEGADPEMADMASVVEGGISSLSAAARNDAGTAQSGTMVGGAPPATAGTPGLAGGLGGGGGGVDRTITVITWINGGADCQKADVTADLVCDSIISRAEAVRHHSEYLLFGFFCAAVIATLPFTHRIYHNTHILYEGLQCVWRGGGGQTLTDLVAALSTPSVWIRPDLLPVLSCAISTFITSLLFFVLVSAAERTYLQRYYYSKYLYRLTSSRKARKCDIPHFRLTKIRNIKMWLYIRYKLKAHGPQKPVEVIVSNCLLLAIVSISALCFTLMDLDRQSDAAAGANQSSGTSHQHKELELQAWICTAWCLTLGFFVLRFITIGTKVNKKYSNTAMLTTERINLTLRIERKPEKTEEYYLADRVLKLACRLITEVESPFKISGLVMNTVLYNIMRVIVLSAFSAVMSEMLGFKLKLWKI